MIDDEAVEVMKELFDSLKNKLESTKRIIVLLLTYHLLHYKCHKINLNCGGSYIDSLDWKKKKKATINPINKKDKKCFKKGVTVSLNHEEIKKGLQRITKTKPFISKYNWEGINFPSEKDDCKKIWKK